MKITTLVLLSLIYTTPALADWQCDIQRGVAADDLRFRELPRLADPAYGRFRVDQRTGEIVGAYATKGYSHTVQKTQYEFNVYSKGKDQEVVIVQHLTIYPMEDQQAFSLYLSSLNALMLGTCIEVAIE